MAFLLNTGSRWNYQAQAVQRYCKECVITLKVWYMEQEFNFVQCWTCNHLVFDMQKGYICQHTGKQYNSKRDIVKPTNCAEWANN